MSRSLSSPFAITAAASTIVSPNGDDATFMGIIDDELVIGNGPTSDIALSVESKVMYFIKNGVKTSLQAEIKSIDDALSAGGSGGDVTAEAAVRVAADDALGDRIDDIISGDTPITPVTTNAADIANILDGNSTFTGGQVTKNAIDIYALSNPLTSLTKTVITARSEMSAEVLELRGSYGNMVSHGHRQLRIRHPLVDPSTNQAAWYIGHQTELPVNPGPDPILDHGDNDLYFEVVYPNGISRIAGFVQDDANRISGPIQMNFTGQHRCMPMFEFSEQMVGMIVESTGKYMGLISEGMQCTQLDCISINDSLPMVRLSTGVKSKSVLGIISAIEDDNRSWSSGNWVTPYGKLAGDTRLFVNSLGEGAVWISDKGGNLQNGDLVTTSMIPGYGMKQDTDFVMNYTVGKITMDCDFNPAQERVKVYDRYDEDTKSIVWEYVVDPDTGEDVYQPAYKCETLEDGTKIAFCGIIYMCG